MSVVSYLRRRNKDFLFTADDVEEYVCPMKEHILSIHFSKTATRLLLGTQQWNMTLTATSHIEAKNPNFYHSQLVQESLLFGELFSLIIIT